MKSEVVQINLWKPHSNQLRVVQDRSRFKVIVCGRRWGKTTYAVNTLVKHALLTPNGLFFYIAPTYRQAKMIAWEMLVQVARSLPEELVTKIHESELYVEIGNQSRVYIKGADHPDSLRGVGLNGCVLDEYADIKPNVFDEIIRPALSDKKGFAIFIGTPKGFNHFYELYNDAPAKGWSTYHFTSYDNPLLDRAELEDIKANTPDDKFAQEYLADFRKQQGLVYKDFDRTRHLYNDKVQINVAETILGIDFGFTNPTAILLIKKDRDNHFWVDNEWYKTGKTTAEIIQVAKAFRPNVVYPDPAEPDRIEEMLKAGLNCRDVIKDVSLGIDAVRELFKQNRLHIHERCKNLIWELETYSYDDAPDFGNSKEEPLKENDHAVDALRYALYMQEPATNFVPYVQPPAEAYSMYGG